MDLYLVKYEKIIFIGTDDTCRAPMAERIYHSLVTDSELDTISRGLVVLFPEPYNPKAEIVLKNHNMTLEGYTAQQLIAEDMNEDSLILTMSESQKTKIINEYGYTKNVYTVKEFVGEEGDVMDPYGKTILEYEDCFVELSRLIKKMVIKMDEKVENDI